ncbi:MAG: VWA domain-containing protein [Candidatus Moranbacteria bacterium]|nr:VWA domain-containing protein [Candidatus Moranbacteria bacterium]
MKKNNFETQNLNSNSDFNLNQNQSKNNKKILIILGLVIGFFILLLIIGFVFIYINILSKGRSFLKDNQQFEKMENEDGNIYNKKTTEREGVLESNNIEEICLLEYEKLMKCNQADFDFCKSSDFRRSELEQAKINVAKNNLILIFDASGSMAGQINGEAKIKIAKDATKNFIDKIAKDNNLNFSMIVYGHKGNNSYSQKQISCAGVEEIYPIGNLDANLVKSKIDSFTATGWTPIAVSFEKAKQVIMSKNTEGGQNLIILVSDGKETCDGDPVGVIKRFKESGLNIQASVIGFDVFGEEEGQLKKIAEAGGGDYFSVKDASDFEMAFQKHENMFRKMDYKIKSSVEQLYDISFVINKYNQCKMMLKKEQTAMILDIYASKIVKPGCEEFVEQRYQKRYDEIISTIENNLQSDKAEFLKMLEASTEQKINN